MTTSSEGRLAGAGLRISTPKRAKLGILEKNLLRSALESLNL